jgi:DNA (cytosine-5)-methyltransferase 1
MTKSQNNVHKKDNLPKEITINGLLSGKLKIEFEGGKSLYDQVAIITHYFQNTGTQAEKKYKKDAFSNIEKILEFRSIEPDSLNSINECVNHYGLFPDIFNIPYPSPEKPKFTFIDLFAGMGGFRLAMQELGGKCVFSSEWNTYAQKTYFANFGDIPFGDITKKEIKKYIPDHFDVLCAGFPCQPFSIAGVSKKNSLGRANGFLDKTQGTLFFDVAEIICKRRPKAFYLENVKNLLSHDKGKTFKIIYDTLNELGYNIHFKVLDAKGYVPQHRERIMIVGFNKDYFHNQEDFSFPNPPDNKKCISDILDNYVDSKYTLSDKLWLYLQEYAKKHKSKGNGFGFGLVDMNDITRTLSARYYKDGSEILIPQCKGMNPRRLTPRECARLMGYNDKYILNAVSDVQGYRQCGNSVVVPLITAVSKKLIDSLLKEK